MPGKFINEINSDKPEKTDLSIFFDKSKNTTAQSSLVDIVAAGLDITSGKAGEAPVVIETVNPDGTKTQTLGWGKTGSSGSSAPPRPANATDLIITHDPASGTDGAATPAQVLTAGLPAGGVAGNVLTFAPGGVAWGTIPNEVPAFTDADDKKQLTVRGITGRSPILEWSSDSSDLPAYTVLDAGKQLTVKADGKSVEWGTELPTLTAGLDALQIKADKSGVEWTSSVNMATNLKGGYTAGAFFPVNDQKTNTTRFVDAHAFRRLSGVPELLYFPNWTPTNDQVGAGWNDMGVALARMAAISQSDVLAGKYTLTSIPGTVFPGSSAYEGGVMLPNGKVLLIPSGATVAKLYDPAANSFSDVPGTTFSGPNAYAGGVLLQNGKVLLIPCNANTAKIYDYLTNSFSDVPGATLTAGGTKFFGGVLLPNGKALLVPRTSTVAKLYDPVANSLADISGTVFPAGNAYFGAVLLPNGKALLVPFGASTAKLYDPVANSFSDVPGATFPANNGGFVGGVLLPTGKVFMTPYNSTVAKLYDPVSNSISDVPGALPGSGAFVRGKLLSSGKVYLISGTASSAKLYDPLTSTFSDISGVTFPSAGAFNGAVLLPSGKALLIPSNATAAMLLENSSPQLGTLPSNFILSPFFNKY